MSLTSYRVNRQVIYTDPQHTIPFLNSGNHVPCFNSQKKRLLEVNLVAFLEVMLDLST